jgi:hypothetical protein
MATPWFYERRIGPSGIKCADRIGVSMYKFPTVVFAPKCARNTQIEDGNILPATDFGLPPLHLENAGKVSGIASTQAPHEALGLE